jgi:hypothetical protein
MERAIDTALGLAAASVVAGRAAARAGLAPARVLYDSPLGDPAVVDHAMRAGLAEQLTRRLLDSPEMQQVIGHIASSPELRAALAEQGSGLAEELAAGVRRRSAAMDDVAERTVRGWLHRPRPRTT